MSDKIKRNSTSKMSSANGSKRTPTRKPYKVDAQAVIEGLRKGKSPNQIAKEQGVSHTSVGRFLKRMRPYFQDIQLLATKRADLLSLLHGKSLGIQERMLTELEKRVEDKAVTDGFTIPQIMSILKGVGVNQAVLFDKMRLERGQSTSNMGLAGLVHHLHSVDGGLIDEATGDFKQSLTEARPHALSPLNDNQSKQ